MAYAPHNPLNPHNTLNKGVFIYLFILIFTTLSQFGHLPMPTHQPALPIAQQLPSKECESYQVFLSRNVSYPMHH